MENLNEANYVMNANGGDVLIKYSISKNFGVATGAGYYMQSANAFNSVGSFFQNREILKIPLVVTFETPLNEDFKFIASLGGYTQNILEDEHTFRFRNSAKEIYSGWNYGAQLGLGFMLNLKPSLGIGLYYAAQTDFTAFKTQENLLFTDEQRLVYLNTLGLVVQF